MDNINNKKTTGGFVGELARFGFAFPYMHASE